MGLEKLELILKSKNMKVTELAELSDVPPTTLKKIVKGQTPNPQYQTVVKIANALNLTIDELIYLLDLSLNENQDPDGILVKYNQLSQHSKGLIQTVLDYELGIKTESSTENNVIIFPMFEANKHEKPTKYRELDYYPMAAGMGSGRQVESTIPEKIRYPESKIPKNTDFVISVSGNSMEPTFSSGDKLFIQSTDHLKEGEIGIFNYMDDQLVKECRNGYLISHNPDYEPIKITGECYVQGKVLGKL